MDYYFLPVRCYVCIGADETTSGSIRPGGNKKHYEAGIGYMGCIQGPQICAKIYIRFHSGSRHIKNTRCSTDGADFGKSAALEIPGGSGQEQNQPDEGSLLKRVMGMYDKNSMKETKEQFEEKVKIRFDNYCSAPVYIIVLTDNKSMYPDYNHWDGPLAAGYLMLSARALGYGTVFITDAIPESVTKEVFGIPDTYTRVCITPLGIPAEWPQSPPKKKLEDFILYEKF